MLHYDNYVIIIFSDSFTDAADSFDSLPDAASGCENFFDLKPPKISLPGMHMLCVTHASDLGMYVHVLRTIVDASNRL